MLHSVGIVVLAHVHSFVAQLLYLRYGALVHAHIVVELHVKFEADTQSDVVADEEGFVPSSASSSCAVVAAGGLSCAPSKCTCAIALHCPIVS